MTPKEKAKQIIDKMARIDGYNDSIDLSTCEDEKKYALILVDEVLSEVAFACKFNDKLLSNYWFWSNVKKEIELL